MIKKILALLLFLGSFNSLAEVLTTKDYRLNISRNCSEGEVDCADVKLEIFHLTQNMLKTEATGMTLHSICKDGTPCRFIGYKFEKGAFTYWVHADGLFEVYMDAKTDPFYSEIGIWKY